jgi:hypothetical protein
MDETCIAAFLGWYDYHPRLFWLRLQGFSSYHSGGHSASEMGLRGIACGVRSAVMSRAAKFDAFTYGANRRAPLQTIW